MENLTKAKHGVYGAVWSETKNGNSVEFKIKKVDENNMPYAVNELKTYHEIEISDEIYNNLDMVAVYSLIKKYCAEKNITLAEPFANFEKIYVK